MNLEQFEHCSPDSATYTVELTRTKYVTWSGISRLNNARTCLFSLTVEMKFLKAASALND